ncbi:MAG: HAD-IIB family hydrolase [Mycoplasmatales bacterium]
MLKLFFDLDGTLLFDGVLSSEYIEQLESFFKRNEAEFNIASGRAIRHITPYTDQLSVPVMNIVGLNGAHLACLNSESKVEIAADGAIIFTKAKEIVNGLSKEQVKRLYELANDEVPILIETDINSFSVSSNQTVKSILGSDFVPVKSFEEVQGESMYMITGLFSEVENGFEKMAAYRLRVETEFPELEVLQNHLFLDITSATASKGQGINQVLTTRENDIIVTIGDNDNDVSMFEVADLAISFNYGSDAAKNAADVCVDDLAGVLAAIEEKIIKTN